MPSEGRERTGWHEQTEACVHYDGLCYDVASEASPWGLTDACTEGGPASDEHGAQTKGREQANPWAVALDAVWSELTREQIDNLPDGVAEMCRANHEALHHPPRWDDPHRFAEKP